MRVFQILFLTTLLLSNALLAQEAERLTSDIQQRLSADEYKLLADQEVSLATFEYPSELPISKGTMILLSNAQEANVLDPSMIHTAKYFAQEGWSSIVMPSPALKIVPEEASEALSEPAVEPEPEANPLEESDTPTEPAIIHAKQLAESFPDATYAVYEAELLRYINIVLQANADTLGHRVFFAEGIAAATFIKLLHDEQLENIDALILQNPFWPEPKLNKLVPNLLANTEVPVLDLTSAQDTHWSRATQRDREIQAQVALKKIYRQRQLAGFVYNENEIESVIKYTRGFISYLGW